MNLQNSYFGFYFYFSDGSRPRQLRTGRPAEA